MNVPFNLLISILNTSCRLMHGVITCHLDDRQVYMVIVAIIVEVKVAIIITITTLIMT